MNDLVKKEKGVTVYLTANDAKHLLDMLNDEAESGEEEMWRDEIFHKIAKKTGY